MFRLMVFDAEKDGSIKNNQFIISLFQFILDFYRFDLTD